MKKQIMIALGLALLALPSVAGAADFSGTYVRDAKASDPPTYPLYWITRDLLATGGASTVIEVKQTASSVQISDAAKPMRNYLLDGQAHVFNTDTGIQKASVTMAAEGDTLVVKTVMPYGGMPGNITMTAQDVWSLSPDGKVLTVVTTRSTPAAEQISKQVFNKR